MSRKKSKTKALETIVRYPGEEPPGLRREGMWQVVLAVIGLVGLLTIPPVWRLAHTQPLPANISVSPLQVGSAVVLYKTKEPVFGGRTTPFRPVRFGVVLQIGEQKVSAPATNQDDWLLTNEGDTVLVVYGIDKNGKDFVQEWNRLKRP